MIEHMKYCLAVKVHSYACISQTDIRKSNGIVMGKNITNGIGTICMKNSIISFLKK